MLRLIENINEANIGNTREKYADLYNGIRQKCSLLKTADDLTLKELCTLCWKATGIILQKMTPENFYEEFFKDYKTLGEFLLDYDDELSVETIIKLGKQDPKYVSSIEKLYNISGVTTAKEDELTFEDLVRWLYLELPSKRIEVDLTGVSDADIVGKNDNLSKKYNKTTIDKNALAKLSAELRKIYEGKPLHEAEEAVPEDKKTVTKNDITLGISNALNMLVQNIWATISDIKSIITSMKDDGIKIEQEENIEKILNLVIDDFTIDLGMVTRASSLLDSEKAALLMNQGTQKAEEVIAEE